MRVEGVSISATARLTGRSRNTVARWLERASIAAELFNRRMLRDFDIVELQADELYTFIGSKSRPMWLFATIEVCSRLWASSLVGRRSYRNTKAVLNDVILRGRLVGIPLVEDSSVLDMLAGINHGARRAAHRSGDLMVRERHALALETFTAGERLAVR